MQAVNASYPGEGDNGARCLRHFIGFAAGDLVLVCKGYRRPTGLPIHIYGFARIIGPFVCEPPGRDVWRFKHKAKIQKIETDAARDLVVNALNRGSLGRTVHDITDVGVEPLARAIRVPITV